MTNKILTTLRVILMNILEEELPNPKAITLETSLSEVYLSTRLSGYGIELLNMVTFILDIQEYYDIEMSDREIDQFKTIGDVASFIDEKLRDKNFNEKFFNRCKNMANTI